MTADAIHNKDFMGKQSGASGQRHSFNNLRANPKMPPQAGYTNSTSYLGKDSDMRGQPIRKNSQGCLGRFHKSNFDIHFTPEGESSDPMNIENHQEVPGQRDADESSCDNKEIIVQDYSRQIEE
jgi:hypothetical protein